MPQELIGEIALEFNLSGAEAHGVVTFYSYFRSELAGSHALELCRAEYLADLFGAQMVGAIHGRLLIAWLTARSHRKKCV